MMKKIPVDIFLNVKECDCGGCFLDRVGGVLWFNDPKTAEFKCNKCDKTEMLKEQEWPQVLYESIESK